MSDKSINQENCVLIDENHQSPITDSQFASDYDPSLIKSMENILISDANTEKTSKKQHNTIRRSLTLKDVSDFKLNRKSGSSISFERIKLAKEKVEEAIKNGKVFAILGPYNRVRQVLRNRGWIEKFYFNNEIQDGTSQQKSRGKMADDRNQISNDGDDIDYDVDDDDVDNDDDAVGDGPNSSGLSPWEEEDGIYGIMSRMLKNVMPNLFWTLRKSQVDYKTLRKDQIINHHAKSGCFTTKTGLAKSLNQLRWFDDKEPDEFFPRCYTISTLEEKHAFIDDFHFSACLGLVKEVLESSSSSSSSTSPSPNNQEIKDVQSGVELTNVETVPNTNIADITMGKSNKKILPKIRYCERKVNGQNYISHKFLEMAIAYCEFILKVKKHEDIDRNDFIFCWSCDWDEFLTNYYKVVHEGFKIEGSQQVTVIKKCEEISKELRKIYAQFDMEGSRNVWILKPGAKSRGRGITCYTKLHEVLKLLSATFVTNETRFIIQKYIERPLLVCNTKFDIRQWFMVTDWNPLTIWWYKDCYLRFCSQQFTLDDLNEAVHLSNNSIQHKYHNGPRSTILPAENMWDWKQFSDWLNNEGCRNAWSTIILPGMKEAVIDVLLCVQDYTEWRKNSFELYGADFMISERDLKPWLIEINSSPCMAPSTSITARLTANVLEDIFKVILDRRENKLTDTGQFELLYKQNQINVPPYIGIDLKLAGISIKNPIMSSSLLTDRRESTRPITDSIIIRNMKRKEGRVCIRRKIPDSSLTSSTIVSNKDTVSKSSDVKQSIMHKRSKTSIVVNDDQHMSKMTFNSLLSRQRRPVSPLLSKSAKLIIDTSKDAPETLKIVQPSLNEIEHEEITEDKEVIPDIKTPELVLDKMIEVVASTNSDKNLNQSNDKVENQSSLPVITKSNTFNKPNPSRQYKLPTKVEVVNFSMAKKMMNKSFKEPFFRKKIRQNNPVNKSVNSQSFFQKYSLTKSIPSIQNFYKSLNKNCKSFSIDETCMVNKSKSSISTRINSKTLKILSKREDDDNNNNLILIKLATPVI